jgi:hypothetical protein
MSPEKYRDYLPDEPDDEPDSTPYLPEGVDRIIVRELDPEPGVWVALWERGGMNDAPMGEFTGHRTAAIAWAREHTNNILILDPEAGDLVPLPENAT